MPAGITTSAGTSAFVVRKSSFLLSVMKTTARSVKFMYGAPLFTRRPISVIWSPGFKVFRVQPKPRERAFGPPISACQRVTFPVVSGTSTTIIEWGLIICNSTTEPSE